MKKRDENGWWLPYMVVEVTICKCMLSRNNNLNFVQESLLNDIMIVEFLNLHYPVSDVKIARRILLFSFYIQFLFFYFFKS